MWAIIKAYDNKTVLLGSWWTSPEDDLDGFFSLYRGPNELIWRVKEPTEVHAKHLNYGSMVKLVCFRKAVKKPQNGQEEFDILTMIAKNDISIVISIDMAIISKNWYQGRRRKDDGMEIRLISGAKSILKNNTNSFFYGGVKYDTRDKLLEIFTELEKSTNDKLTINSDAKTKEIEYRNFTSLGNPLDTIDKIANDNNLEYFLKGSELFIAKMITNNILGQNVAPTYTYVGNDEYVNTVFKSKFKYRTSDIVSKLLEIEVVSGGFPDVLPLPGSEINLFNVGKRVIYLNIQFGKKIGAHSVFVAIETIAVPRSLVYDLMPEKGRQIFSTEYAYKYPNILYGDIQKYIEYPSGETIRRNVNLGMLYSRHDPENMDFENVSTTPIIFDSSPYAGAEVGIQFPKNIGGKVIILAPDSKYESSTIVGQIFQENKMPKRTDIADYRLTLGGAATQYYDHSGKARWDVTKKRNIIGVSDSITHDAVPKLTDLKSYIQLGDTTTEGAEKAIIKVGSQTITLNGSTIVIDDGTRKITMNGSTVDVT